MTDPFLPKLLPLLPVEGAEDVRLRRIFCVGRNYEAHAREMGKDPTRDPPFFFTKWAETAVIGGGEIAYPPGTENYHYEVELVALIGAPAFRVPADRALDSVCAYAVGLDMTRRDLQLKARAEGRPWDTGKNFDQSAPLGVFHPISAVGHPKSGTIRLLVNGETKQEADLADLIWPVADVVAFLSELYPLHPGDIIMTGTPAGVGPVKPGDRLVACVEGLTPLEVTIGEAA
ncbi:FAA hydrolase family protein [Sinorhizobium meliloti]|nr:FAA hydrolase family protein [Sinorhizobium meliloti]